MFPSPSFLLVACSTDTDIRLPSARTQTQYLLFLLSKINLVRDPSEHK
ncbi:hypothetical protein VFMJ11_1813 [Aliivibrio fischeri MJ11]|uniref:Uncharacterized protein n=1 Tax=Aliivibrio fischeri (strain MJ11) TaxID=388396 RepID=B5FFM9_ALIFM|nr:hypothetical protein VFMJ11_1813 [Aliivibrio fischeri MJ11]